MKNSIRPTIDGGALVYSGRKVFLTETEQRIMAALILALPGRASLKGLLFAAFPDRLHEFRKDVRVLDVHINSIRAKLTRKNIPLVIASKYGEGRCLVLLEEEAA